MSMKNRVDALLSEGVSGGAAPGVVAGATNGDAICTSAGSASEWPGAEWR